MSISRQARITRTAISPRFAIRTFLNMRELRFEPTIVLDPAWTEKAKPLPTEGLGQQLFTELLVLFALQFIFHSKAGIGFQLRRVSVGRGPVNEADRVVELGVIRIDRTGLFVVFPGIVELLHVHVKVGDSFHAIDAFRVFLKHSLILFNRLLGHAVVFRRVHAGHVLLGIGRSQIQLGHFEVLVIVDGILEVIDGLLVVCALVGMDALIELVARPQFVAPRCAQQGGCDGQQRRESCASVHFSGSLPELENFWVLRRTTAQDTACCGPHAKESKNHWPSKIFAVIRPTRSTTCVPRAVSITWATYWNSISLSPCTNITRSARVLKMSVRRVPRLSQLTSSWVIFSLGFPPFGAWSTCTTTLRSADGGVEFARG